MIHIDFIALLPYGEQCQPCGLKVIGLKGARTWRVLGRRDSGRIAIACKAKRYFRCVASTSFIYLFIYAIFSRIRGCLGTWQRGWVGSASHLGSVVRFCDKRAKASDEQNQLRLQVSRRAEQQGAKPLRLAILIKIVINTL